MGLRRFVSLLSVIFLIVGCSVEEERKYSMNGIALGTPFNTIYFSEYPIKNLKTSLDSIFNEINQSMSTYISESDISKINNGDKNILVDDHFIKVFKKSKEIWKTSGGFFDPTAGIITKANGLGPKNFDNEKDLTKLLELTGFNKVQLKNKSIIKENEDIFLDFNAIAKGYCVDVISEFFEQKKIDNFLVEIGGEMVSRGLNKSTNNSWKVGISDPVKPDSPNYFTKIELKNRALASSGNYRKYKVDKTSGNKIVHTVNPKSGESIETDVVGVSVVANDCMTADAYATAFMVMPMEDSIKIINENNEIDVLIIYLNDLNEIDTFSTKGFESLTSN
ncbi:MAG: thiamine biosynthesis protein ApbE [Flavobacteriaceae bacterium]|nr:thiamine biosynthesis protein ApbE [Flavobacteriaceae bacterium]